MSDRPSKTISDLTDSWPADHSNEDLARLGQDLFANRPELSQLALDRIQIRMRQELNRPWWQRRWRTLFASFIAVLAVSIAAYAWIKSAGPHTTARENGGKSNQRSTVHDHYDVTLPTNSPKPPDKPLIDLQPYNDLFERENKEQKR